MRKNFYCQRVVGDANFSISEWNEQFKICCELEIDMPSDKLDPCENQCFDCMAIVGERQKKTCGLSSENKQSPK